MACLRVSTMGYYLPQAGICMLLCDQWSPGDNSGRDTQRHRSCLQLGKKLHVPASMDLLLSLQPHIQSLLNMTAAFEVLPQHLGTPILPCYSLSSYENYLQLLFTWSCPDSARDHSSIAHPQACFITSSFIPTQSQNQGIV